MKRTLFANSAAIGICLCLGAPLLADEPAMTSMSAEKCLTDLLAFDNERHQDGYWLGGSGYGYGYPAMGGWLGYGDGNGEEDGNDAALGMSGFQNARPGLETKVLFAAAHILAQNGQQQACEEVLAVARSTYKLYVADMQSGRMPMADVPGWRQQQVAAAQPVTAQTTAFRTDQLLGIKVRNPQDEALGSVDDIVLSPKTGKIAYLVIARGGLFGFDQSYVPVPWADFKVTPATTLLVLDTTKAVMKAAPLVSRDHFAAPGQFEEESRMVDTYWKANL